MVKREDIKWDVVHVIDILSPLDLQGMDKDKVETVKINYTSGFDGSLKRALCIPLTKIARKHNATTFRPMSQTESAALKTIGGAIDLTLAAATGQPYDGE